MKYATICSGINAPAVAWNSLGWQEVFCAEIEPFPCAVLAQHHPDVPNYGDLTHYATWPLHQLDVLCGGTPCQSFSVAGLRKGMADPRGNLALIFLGLVDKYRPTWVVWENVPGVHSSWSDEATFAASEAALRAVREARQAVVDAGIDLGADFSPGDFEECDQTNDLDGFIAGLEELGYGVATRILDAQYVRVDSHPGAVPQRRRRVFVVGHLGASWQRAAAVLLERESLRGDPAPRRTQGQGTTGTLSARAEGGGGLGTDFECGGVVVPVAPPLDASFGRLHGQSHQDANLGHPHLVPCCFDETQITSKINRSQPQPGDPSHALASGARPPAIVFPARMSGTQSATSEEVAPVLQAENPTAVMTLAIRGRGDSHELEYRQDGTANAVLTPNGGRAGIGVGAVATFQQSSLAGKGTMGYDDSGVAKPAKTQHHGSAVRRLTPRECERLQGFPDDYTLIPHRLLTKIGAEADPSNPKHWAADGPRYKALGNSMAVNVMRWIGQRIALVDAIAQSKIINQKS